MKLVDCLRQELIQIGLRAQSKYEAIEEMIDRLIFEHEIPMRHRVQALRVVLERENHMSTGLEHGVAIPHGATESVDEIVGAMAISPDGIPFDSRDGEPASIIVLLLIPKIGFTGHARTLAGVVTLLSDPQLRQALLASEAAEEAMKAIHASETNELRSGDV